MAHPLQSIHVATASGTGIAEMTVEQVKALLTDLEYAVIEKEHWEQAATVVRCARAVVQLRDQGEASTKANEELAFAIDQLDGEDWG
jgi:hypothetical protein